MAKQTVSKTSTEVATLQGIAALGRDGAFQVCDDLAMLRAQIHAVGEQIGWTGTAGQLAAIAKRLAKTLTEDANKRFNALRDACDAAGVGYE